MPLTKSNSKKQRRRGRSKKRKQRSTKGGSWLTSSSDWKLGNTIVDAGYNIPLSNIGSTNNYFYNTSYPIDNYYTLPCMDYTQSNSK